MSNETVLFRSDLLRLRDFLGIVVPSKSFNDDKLIIDSLPCIPASSTTLGVVGSVGGADIGIGGGVCTGGSALFGFKPDNN
jgi:hypothetical protein